MKAHRVSWDTTGEDKRIEKTNPYLILKVTKENRKLKYPLYIAIDK